MHVISLLVLGHQDMLLELALPVHESDPETPQSCHQPSIQCNEELQI